MTENAEQQKRDDNERVRNGLMIEALRFAYENARDGKVEPILASERAFTYCFGTTTAFWYKDLTQMLLTHAKERTPTQ